MPVRLHESDRFEPLWGRFLAATEPGTSRTPMRPEVVAVPGGGWESWLTQGLCEERGATVRPRCVSLSALLLEVQRAAEGVDEEGRTFFDLDAWTLRIAAALGGSNFLEKAGPLAAWLSGGGGGDAADRLERRVQLGRRLAGMLDRCLLTRPEVVEALASGDPRQLELDGPAAEHFAWQARLFGPLLRGSGLGPAGPAYRELGERLAREREGDAPHPAAPARLCVWTVGAIAPAQLDGLEMLDAAGCKVTALVLSASTQFLADLLPAAWFDEETAAELDDPDLHRERPHPLLAAWGQLTRDRQALLEERGGAAWAPVDQGGDLDEEVPADRGLLAALQATVRGARPPEPMDLPADGTLAVHGCANTRRCVEVLRDRLLVAFDELPGLRQEDVVIACPDPELFAPHVEAAFGAGELRVNLAGRSPRRERPAVTAFYRLLGVLGGRAEAPELLGLAADPAFSAGAGLDPEEVAELGSDLAAAGVTWGFDAGFRAAAGRTEAATHAWEAGLDRLVLGSLLPPPEAGDAGGLALLPPPIGAVVPVDRATRAEELGRLSGFLGRLRAAFDAAAEPADAGAWAARAVAWTEDFFEDGFDDFGRAQVRDAAAGLARDAEEAGLTEPLPLAVWAAELGRRLDGVAGGGRFRSGGITLCEPAAVRGLPHRVVAWLGLTDGAFPRRTPGQGFDLSTLEHRPGDRPAAAVDRSLLLESLMAAGDRFLVVCEDRDAHGQPRPLAAVVAELLDAAAPLVGGDVGGLVHRHPMHPFSPEAFDAERPSVQGVDAAMLDAAGRLLGKRGRRPAGGSPPPAVFAPVGRSPSVPGVPEERSLREPNTPGGGEPPARPAADNADATLRELEDLLTAAWKLRLAALGVARDFTDPVPDAEDPMALDALEDWALREALLDHAMAGRPAADTRRLLAAAGRTPVGPMAAAPLDRLAAEAGGVAALARENAEQAGGNLHGVRVDLEVEAHRLTGSVPRVGRGVFLSVTSGRMKPARLARVWVSHLALAAHDGRPRVGVLVGREEDTAGRPGVRVFAPLGAEEARAHLADLLRWRDEARTRPLPCHAGVAARFFDHRGDGAFDPGRAGDALSFFSETPFTGGGAPADDPDVGLAFGGADPMSLRDADGRNLQALLAEALWSPLFACLRAGSGEDA